VGGTVRYGRGGEGHKRLQMSENVSGGENRTDPCDRILMYPFRTSRAAGDRRPSLHRITGFAPLAPSSDQWRKAR
jgi:hypothetical protein